MDLTCVPLLVYLVYATLVPPPQQQLQPQLLLFLSAISPALLDQSLEPSICSGTQLTAGVVSVQSVMGQTCVLSLELLVFANHSEKNFSSKYKNRLFLFLFIANKE